MIRRTPSSGLHLDHARLDYYFMFIIRKSACFERTRQSLGNQLAAAGFLPGQATMMIAQILTCISLFSTNSLFEKPVPQMQSLTCTQHFDQQYIDYGRQSLIFLPTVFFSEKEQQSQRWTNPWLVLQYNLFASCTTRNGTVAICLCLCRVHYIGHATKRLFAMCRYTRQKKTQTTKYSIYRAPEVRHMANSSTSKGCVLQRGTWQIS